MRSMVIALMMVLGAGSAQAKGKSSGKLPRLLPGGCAESHRVAEEQIAANHLIDASQSLAVCARKACGASLGKQCQLRKDQVDLDIPTVIPLLDDTAGKPVVDVTVTSDGLPLLSRADGRAVSLDPGPHELAFTTPGGQVLKQQLVIVQGQRNREVKLALGDPPDVFEQAAALPVVKPAAPAPTLFPDDPLPPAPKRTGGIGPYVLAGVGLVGVGGYLLLTHWGRQDNDALAACTPNCRPEAMHHIRMLYLAADASAGVGVAALVGATTWFVLRHRANRERYAIDVVPTPRGGMALVTGKF